MLVDNSKSLVFLNYGLNIRLNNFPASLIIAICSVVLLIMSAILLYELSELFENFSIDKVFIYKNAKHLKNIGIITIAGGVIYSLMGYFVSRNLMNVISVKNGKVELGIPCIDGFIITGLMIIVIAEVFKEAIKIKEDNDMTV